jgi:plasmid stabilization system protein ParE
LIAYTPDASRQVAALVDHYRTKQRPEALRNLNDALARAEATILAGPKNPRKFPATYSDLVRPGVMWLKSRSYWIAYQQRTPPVIVAVFWHQAVIDRRYPNPD